MNIYSITVDVEKYQWLIPEIPKNERLEFMTFDCLEKIDKWKDIEWYRFNPKKKEGNFFYVSPGAFAFDENVYNSDLFDILETSGEILPIKLGTKPLFIVNILECVNSLNENLTKFDMYNDGTKGRILEYSFYPDRFSESSLFKIPETSKAEILTYTGLKGDEDEFFYLYQKLGFEGLVFTKIF